MVKFEQSPSLVRSFFQDPRVKYAAWYFKLHLAGSIVNGFKHPRTLIADFTVAEQTLKYFLKLVLPTSPFKASPIIVIHPQAQLEGGLTQIEIRAFAELGLGAGARRVFVWDGPELTREELGELRFSRVGGKLLHPPKAE